MPQAHDQHEADESIRRGYEIREVNLRALGWFVLGFIVCGAILAVFVWWLIGFLAGTNLPSRPPVALWQPGGVAAPQPRIQPSAGQLQVPSEDLLQFRAAEEKTLTTYGWVDRAQGIARIPVDRAEDLALQKHLFPQASPQTQESPHAPR
jgi:hypothetical protein